MFSCTAPLEMAAAAPTTTAGWPAATVIVMIGRGGQLVWFVALDSAVQPCSHWPSSSATCTAAHCSCGGESRSIAITHDPVSGGSRLNCRADTLAVDACSGGSGHPPVLAMIEAARTAANLSAIFLGSPRKVADL